MLMPIRRNIYRECLRQKRKKHARVVGVSLRVMQLERGSKCHLRGFASGARLDEFIGASLATVERSKLSRIATAALYWSTSIFCVFVRFFHLLFVARKSTSVCSFFQLFTDIFLNL